MEAFYKAFYLVRAFLRADAAIPKPVDLPDAEDRFITEQREKRRDFPILDVIGALAVMAQPDLIEAAEAEDKPVNAVLSAEAGLQEPLDLFPKSEAVSVTPMPAKQ
jgi:hypothetical protein